MVPPPFHMLTSTEPSRSHVRTRGHIARSRPLLNKAKHITVWLLDKTTEKMAAAKFRLQCVDYNGCEGHLTGILDKG